MLSVVLTTMAISALGLATPLKQSGASTAAAGFQPGQFVQNCCIGLFATKDDTKPVDVFNYPWDAATWMESPHVISSDASPQFQCYATVNETSTWPSKGGCYEWQFNQTPMDGCPSDVVWKIQDPDLCPRA